MKAKLEEEELQLKNSKFMAMQRANILTSEYVQTKGNENSIHPVQLSPYHFTFISTFPPPCHRHHNEFTYIIRGISVLVCISHLLFGYKD